MLQVPVQNFPPGSLLLPTTVHVVEGVDKEARVAGVIVGHREPEEKGDVTIVKRLG